MKRLILFLVISILFIGGCQKSDKNVLNPNSRIGEVSGNNFKAEMYMFPSPDTIRRDDPLNLKFLIINFGKNKINGRISVSDAPDNFLGGIQEPAEIEFTVDGIISEKSVIEEIIVPEARDILYSGDVNITKFLAIITYNVENEYNSDKFCLKHYSSENIKSCNFKGTLKSLTISTLTNKEYEYYDSDDDNIVDRLTLKFELNEACDILSNEQEIIDNMVVSLKNSDTSFDCSIDTKSSNEKRKTIKCVNRDVLNIVRPYYNDNIVAKFKYDCGLTLRSGFINLNKGG